MHRNVSQPSFALTILFILGTSTLFSQVNIKERVEIKPKTASKVRINGIDFELTNAIIIPYKASVDIQSTMYAPWVCPRDLLFDGQVVLQGLQNTPTASLGIFEGGSQLSFTLVQKDCNDPPGSPTVYPMTAVRAYYESTCGSLYEIGTTWDDGSGDPSFNDSFVIVIVSPIDPVPPYNFTFDVGTGLTYFPLPAILSTTIRDACGGLADVPGVTISAEILEGQQW
jgi:hypothetical protein